jgi:pimeloyl-ACP methyl ester carboxylesterase
LRLVRRIGWLALAALAAALAAGGILWRGSERLLRPEGYAHPGAGSAGGAAPPDPAIARDLVFEVVRFPTAGGSELDGWFVPGAKSFPFGVVLVHGAGEDRRAFLDHVPFLHEVGYSLLLFDLRDHGASAGAARGSGLGFRELADVSAAVRFAKRERALRRVAVLASGLGADAALLAAAGDSEIDAVIAETPYGSTLELARSQSPDDPEWLRRAVVDLALRRVGAWREPQPIDVVASVAPIPLVLVGTAGDPRAPQETVSKLFAAAREPKEIWIAERGERGALLAAEPEEYPRRILGFLGRWLAPPAPRPEAEAAPPAAEPAAP